MSDQLPMFEQTTCEDTLSTTGLPGPASGATPCGSRDGPTTGQPGPQAAPVSRSRRRVTAQARLADLSTATGPERIGYLLGPNGWEIVPASGQLTPITAVG